MYKLQTLNKIAATGLDPALKAGYEAASEILNPDAILVRSASMHDMELSPTVKAIARAGAGVNNIPIDDYTHRGIVVFNTPGANANAVAEEVVALMLADARHVVPADASTRAGKWEKKKFMGREVTGKVYGLLNLRTLGLYFSPVNFYFGVNGQFEINLNRMDFRIHFFPLSM